MRTVSSVLLLLVGAASSIAGLEQQQGDKPVFRSTTHVVEVTVIVRDQKGAFVPNLTAEDFEVREDDRVQHIESLYVVRASRNESPSGTTSASPSPPETASRTFIFLFDMEHLTSNGVKRARDAVARFVDGRLVASDLAGVAAIGSTTRTDVGTDRRALVEIVKGLKPLGSVVSRMRDLAQWPRVANETEAIQIATRQPGALDKAIERACAEGDGACNGNGEAKGAGQDGAAARAQIEAQIELKAVAFVRDSRAAGQRSVAALDEIARTLGALRGRKTVIWVSEGTFSDELTEQARGAAYRAAQAGVAIYSLDPSGLARRTSANFDQYALSEVGSDVLQDRAGDAAVLLSAGSGGLAIRNENNLDRALREIEDDTSSYYVLGYAAPEGRDRAGYRKLRVTVRREGLAVRARHGYMAPRTTSTVAATVATPPSIAVNPTTLVPEGSSIAVGTPEPPASTLTGSVVTSRPPSAVRTVRLRPDAEKNVEVLSRKDTASAGALATKGWDAYQRGDVETAAAAFGEAATRDDVRPWVLYALGLSGLALAKPADAAAAWERVRIAAPEFSPVYMDLADAYWRLGDASKALAVLRDAEQRWPSDSEVQNGIGVILVRRGALDEAIAAFAKAVAAAPDDPNGYFNLGRAYELRFLRGQRYVSSSREWVSFEDDRARAEQNYTRCVALHGPYTLDAMEGINRLAWSKK